MFIAVMAIAVWSFADERQEQLHRDAPVTEERGLRVEVDYALGNFTLKPSAPDKAFVVDLSYPRTLFDPEVDYDIRGDIGHLTVRTEQEHKGINIDWDDKEKSTWDIQFNPRLPAELDLNVGLGKGMLELGGATISEISLENGLADTELDFSAPNRTQINYMDFETGLGKFRAKNLMNARFREMDFECGMGAATLDFHGEGLDRCEVDLSVGLGSLHLIIPEDIGVRVEVDKSFMSSVSFDDSFRMRDEYYYTTNWNNARKRMKIDLEVGLGSADIDIEP